MDDKLEYVTRIFYAARMRGICKTQGDFARLLGMNNGTISKALQGDDRYLTDNFIKRVQTWAQQRGLEGEETKEPVAVAAEPKERAADGVFIPRETLELYTSLAKSVDRLSAMVERMQPGGSVYGGAYAPKNFQTDGK